MATITLRRPPAAPLAQAHPIVGRATGVRYGVNQFGEVTVDTSDAAHLQAQGWLPAFGQFGGQATSGVVLLDFGSFPGSAAASVTVASSDASDPNAEIDAWVIPVATVDHAADEHVADPPRVRAAIVAGNIVISGFPSGRDLPVPPGTPFGNTTNSQMPVGQQQLMPVGKWSVAWAFSP